MINGYQLGEGPASGLNLEFVDLRLEACHLQPFGY